jgi:hypothetical protein
VVVLLEKNLRRPPIPLRLADLPEQLLPRSTSGALGPISPSALKAMCWSAGLVGVRVRGLHRPRGELRGVYASLEAMSMRTTSPSRSS